jgi:hypothetical protein
VTGGVIVVIVASREWCKHIAAPHINPSAIWRLTQTPHKLCNKLLLKLLLLLPRL